MVSTTNYETYLVHMIKMASKKLVKGSFLFKDFMTKIDVLSYDKLCTQRVQQGCRKVDRDRNKFTCLCIRCV